MRAALVAVAVVLGVAASVARALGAAAPATAAGVRSAVGVERDVPTGARVSMAVRAAHPRVLYHGGPVLHSSRSRVIFWQPPGLAFDSGYGTVIGQFLERVAAASHRTGNLFGLTGQYHDRRGPAAYASTYAGAVLDVDPLPPNRCHEPRTGPPGWSVCLTDAQLESEIDHVVAVNRLPRHAPNIYFLVLPNGFGSCLDASSGSCALGGPQSGYCGYHLVTGRGVLYAVIPYNAISGHCQSDAPRPNSSTADPTLSTLAHEQSEIVTDPVGNAWSTAGGEEVADVCLQDFGPVLGGGAGAGWNEVIAGGHYFLQALWSNAAGRCAARAPRDRVSVAGPRRVRVGRRTSFAARASAPHASIVSWLWSFGGRGGRGRGPRPGHVWRHPGSYRVVVRVTDSNGNWAFGSRAVRVVRR